MAVDERQNLCDQLVAAKIRELAQADFASEVGGVERVAPRAAQGAFLRNFNRERWRMAGQNPRPGMEYFGSFRGSLRYSCKGLPFRAGE
jgi:hypothetical protein